MARLRNTMGSVSLVIGCCLYASSNVIGHGWNIAPDPSKALLFSAAGMLLCVLAVVITPECLDRCELVSIMKAVFLLGAFSLIATLGMAVAHPFFDLDNQSWGAIPPPGLIFGALYGSVSVTAVLALQIWEQQDGTVYEFTR
jgi:hypothetical protein